MADVAALTALAERVQEFFVGRQVDDLLREPAAGEWSALRTLGHMIASAQVLHDQLDRMAHMTDPLLPMVDDAAVAEREQWEARAPHELVGLFVEAIGGAEGLLKHLPDSSWGRAGLHPLGGRRSIVQQVRGGGPPPSRARGADRGGAGRGVAGGASRLVRSHAPGGARGEPTPCTHASALARWEGPRVVAA